MAPISDGVLALAAIGIAADWFKKVAGTFVGKCQPPFE
jgi:hypothetical protein